MNTSYKIPASHTWTKWSPRSFPSITYEIRTQSLIYKPWARTYSQSCALCVWKSLLVTSHVSEFRVAINQVPAYTRVLRPEEGHEWFDSSNAYSIHLRKAENRWDVLAARSLTSHFSYFLCCLGEEELSDATALFYTIQDGRAKQPQFRKASPQHSSTTTDTATDWVETFVHHIEMVCPNDRQSAYYTPVSCRGDPWLKWSSSLSYMPSIPADM